jgi:hypothetical protein
MIKEIIDAGGIVGYYGVMPNTSLRLLDWTDTHTHAKCTVCKVGFVWNRSSPKPQCFCGCKLQKVFNPSYTPTWHFIHWHNGNRFNSRLEIHPAKFALYPQSRFSDWQFIAAQAEALTSKDSGDLIQIGHARIK